MGVVARGVLVARGDGALLVGTDIVVLDVSEDELLDEGVFANRCLNVIETARRVSSIARSRSSRTLRAAAASLFDVSIDTLPHGIPRTKAQRLAYDA